MRFFTLLILLLVSSDVLSQIIENPSDTVKVLGEVVVQAYRSGRPLSDVPATINVITPKDLTRYGPASLVTTVNTVPGVRMEERSPGSYRFSIRGSVMRSPFGIRNVKFYWKGMPFTDGGGNTYLNLLDVTTVGKMEIIKGPGSSLYGASTGGVVLLDSPPIAKEYIQASVLVGSYGLSRKSIQLTFGEGTRSNFDIALSNQQSNGYRQQTALNRSNLRLNYDQAIAKKGKLSFTYLYANLNYQTPGGLNKAQYESDPREARPATQTGPGAVGQQAEIFNKTHYFGTIYQHDWNEKWSTSIGAYGSVTDFKNPAILNYEHRNENNVGGRTETQYTFGKDDRKHKITFGAEYQMLKGPDRVYTNTAGVRGALQTDDRLTSKAFFTFAQAEFQLPYEFLVTAGGSLNYLNYNFKRVSVDPNLELHRNFSPGLFPRLALIKKFGEQFSVYSSVSEGFSAPTLAEVLPSTGVINTGLNAEKGRSIEVGIRSELFNRQVKLNVATYDFRLKNTIVVRTDGNGADYFANVGTTSQKGIESTISWQPWAATSRPDILRVWTSYTYNDYHFLDYQNNGNDYSGNKLTGVPPTVVVGGVDFSLRGWYFNAAVNYTDHIAVNDANSEYAHDYKIVSGRVGKRFTTLHYLGIDIFAGVDNAFDQKYSLGNDLNALGGRYYNVAPGRNFYGGLNITIHKRELPFAISSNKVPQRPIKL
ncbi:MAG: TonB-dependent receptor [Bacteroidota bacterium]